MAEESEYLYNNLKAFTMEQAGTVEWDRIDKEIAYLEKGLTYAHVRDFYESQILAAHVHPTIFRVFS